MLTQWVPCVVQGNLPAATLGSSTLTMSLPAQEPAPPLPTVKFVVNKPATSRPPAQLFHLNDFVKDI